MSVAGFPQRGVGMFYQFVTGTNLIGAIEKKGGWGGKAQRGGEGYSFQGTV